MCESDSGSHQQSPLRLANQQATAAGPYTTTAQRRAAIGAESSRLMALRWRAASDVYLAVFYYVWTSLRARGVGSNPVIASAVRVHIPIFHVVLLALWLIVYGACLAVTLNEPVALFGAAGASFVFVGHTIYLEHSQRSWRVRWEITKILEALIVLADRPAGLLVPELGRADMSVEDVRRLRKDAVHTRRRGEKLCWNLAYDRFVLAGGVNPLRNIPDTYATECRILLWCFEAPVERLGYAFDTTAILHRSLSSDDRPDRPPVEPIRLRWLTRELFDSLPELAPTATAAVWRQVSSALRVPATFLTALSIVIAALALIQKSGSG